LTLIDYRYNLIKLCQEFDPVGLLLIDDFLDYS